MEEWERDELNDQAEEYKRSIDGLNEEMKEWSTNRDEFNAEVRMHLEKAKRHKENRDELNAEVKRSKEQRDEYNRMSQENTPDKRMEGEVLVKQLKKQLRDLEFTQQTKPLGEDKENELIKQISLLTRQIKKIEKAAGSSGNARAEAEKHHSNISEYAKLAQAEHDAMLSSYEQADILRLKADAAHKKFMECKEEADEKHKKYTEIVAKIKTVKKDKVETKTVVKKKEAIADSDESKLSFRWF